MNDVPRGTRQRPGLRVRFYKDATGGWRWSVLAANNRILSSSTEGYDRRRDCKANLELTERALFTHLSAVEALRQ